MDRDEPSQHCSFVQFFFLVKTIWAKKDSWKFRVRFSWEHWWWAAQFQFVIIQPWSCSPSHAFTKNEFWIFTSFLTNRIVLNKYTCNSNSSSFNLEVRNTSTFIDELVTSEPRTVLPGLCFRKTSHFHVPDFSKPMLRIFIPHSPLF